MCKVLKNLGIIACSTLAAIVLFVLGASYAVPIGCAALIGYFWMKAPTRCFRVTGVSDAQSNALIAPTRSEVMRAWLDLHS